MYYPRYVLLSFFVATRANQLRGASASDRIMRFFSNARSSVLHILFLHNAVARSCVNTLVRGVSLDIGYFRVILVESEGEFPVPSLKRAC